MVHRKPYYITNHLTILGKAWDNHYEWTSNMNLIYPSSGYELEGIREYIIPVLDDMKNLGLDQDLQVSQIINTQVINEGTWTWIFTINGFINEPLEEDKEYLKQILSKVREAFPRDDNELDEPIINYLNNVITVIVPWSW